MKKIKLSKIEHRKEVRIQVLFAKDAGFISKIKRVPGRKWSKTKNCWHLPYSAESFKALKAIFGESRLEYDKKDKEKERIKEGALEPQFAKYQKEGVWKRKVSGEQVIIKQRDRSLIEAYVPFEKKRWKEVFKNIAGRSWDVENTCWLLPNVRATYRHLYKYIGKENLVFHFDIPSDIPEAIQIPLVPKKGRERSFELLTEPQKTAVLGTEEQLLLKRYSPSTLKSYRNHLIDLFLFHKSIAPDQVGIKEVQDFLLYKIRKKRVSESTQNQIINAYKAYAERVLGLPKAYIEIPRPKKPKKMPGVLSTKEVVALIGAVDNLKHKFALLLIYSAGLRRSELLNLLVKDINVDRRVIHIKGGKGKKDRYVTLARTVIPYLEKYLKPYHPERWLFSGQSGGRYSASSLQKVFERALKRSKINSYATLHTLRHSYATHCVENGHNLKSVQEALGHQSLKTTEIYLHISSDALKKLESPLDNLTFRENDD